MACFEAINFCVPAEGRDVNLNTVKGSYHFFQEFYAASTRDVLQMGSDAMLPRAHWFESALSREHAVQDEASLGGAQERLKAGFCITVCTGSSAAPG